MFLNKWSIGVEVEICILKSLVLWLWVLQVLILYPLRILLIGCSGLLLGILQYLIKKEKEDEQPIDNMAVLCFVHPTNPAPAN